MTDSLGEVRARSEAWMGAWVTRDRATLESLMTDDYSLVISSSPAARFERGLWLDLAVGPYVCTRFEYRDVQLRPITDDLVAMSSIGDFDATIDGEDRSGQFFLTDLWRREAEGWKVCARFSSPLFDDAGSIGKMAR